MRLISVTSISGRVKHINFDLVKMIEFANYNDESLRSAIQKQVGGTLEPCEEDAVWLLLNFVAEGHCNKASSNDIYGLPITPEEKARLESIFAKWLDQ